MAVARMVLNNTTVVPAGAATTVSQAFGGTVSWAGAAQGTGANWADGFPVTFPKGSVLYVDSTTATGAPTGPQALYGALIAAGGTLRAWTTNDETGHAALSN